MSDNAKYDIIVIGAGIHGAGFSQAAAAAGYRVLALEQSTVASGTSSRSSKLIHGGLRYLEQFRLGLVRECLSERETLLRIAPELVQLRDFLIPVYRNSQRRPWQIRTGLSLYSLLGGLGTHTHFEGLDKSRWPSLDGLTTDGLHAVFKYQDAQTDDVKLTRSVMASAISLGAELLESARFIRANSHKQGCTVSFEHGHNTRELHACAVVNAAGPWARQVADCFTPRDHQPVIELVQGAHILLTAPQVKDIYYLEAPQDGRAIFVMPWQNHTLVGTTETPYTGADPSQIKPTAQEKQYLQDVIAHYFPSIRFSPISSYAGLRVLPGGDGARFRRSRELLLIRDRKLQPNVLHLYGGKLTSYRADAERALRILKPMLPKRHRLADTRKLPLLPA